MSASAAALTPAYRLVTAVQELSLARELGRVMEIVRHAARDLTGADGATFVLREGANCHYADEDAIAPLWKGKRFPLETCISGWTMLNREAVAIADIYADARIPADAYRPTFVQSLAMVPIRQSDPVGAIGIYWAQRHTPTADELRLLQALADSSSVAMENVRVYGELERRVRDRTAELELANQELEAFAYTVSHDLRAPVRHIDGYAGLLATQPGPESARYLGKIREAAQRMNELIDDTLKLSRVSRATLTRVRLDLSAMATEVLTTLAGAEPGRTVAIEVAPGLQTEADAGLVRIALENLLGNAWKFTARAAEPRIIFGRTEAGDFFVRDNGVGFPPEAAARLFQAFQRLHRDFAGNGIGLATVRRIVEKHSGTIRGEGTAGAGATFYFTLG